MRLIIPKTLLIATILLVATQITWAAEGVQSTWSCSKSANEKTCSFDMQIQGEITPAIVDGVKKALVDRREMIAREGGDSDWWIVNLNSPGGSVEAAFEIGRLFRSVDAPVAIAPEQQCVSACVLILAGASHRNIHGRVGIHRPYLEPPGSGVGLKDVQKAYTSTAEKIRSYLREMNVSDRLADDMMIVAPEQVRYLTPAELAAYGLRLVDPVAEEEADLKEAIKLGIDRGNL